MTAVAATLSLAALGTLTATATATARGRCDRRVGVGGLRDRLSPRTGGAPAATPGAPWHHHPLLAKERN
ncbi:hypothetical protein [Streptacidiphilus jiangxiensis]|nr:hypothetical protein [Streptacidiphilus jiangxiensis]